MNNDKLLARWKRKQDKFAGEIGTPIDFKEFDDEARLRCLSEVFDLPDFKHIQQVRESAIYESMRKGGHDKVAAARYEAATEMLARIIGEAVMWCAEHNGSRVKKLSTRQAMSDLDAADPKIRDAKHKFFWNANAVVFIADLLDMYVSNINDALLVMFPSGQCRYSMLDDVSRLKQRLQTFFDHTSNDGSAEQRMLFADYAESINNYMDKRINSFITKTMALRKREQRAKEGKPVKATGKSSTKASNKATKQTKT